MTALDECHDYVIHPRYGQRPRITGLNPQPEALGKVFLHWHSPKELRIPNTAIPADTTKQLAATIPVTHYYDVRRRCHDCGRPFLFFAQEQKYWYEELKFPLEADCIRCINCRKLHQTLAQQRKRYEALFSIPNRNSEQTLEMVECCLSLIEGRIFHRQQLQHLRMLLNSLHSLPKGLQAKAESFWQRLRSIEDKRL